MTEQESAAAAIDDSGSAMQELIDDAVEMGDIDEPDLGDVLSGPGELVGVVDGVEVLNVADESDHVLSIEDGSGQVIGSDGFPDNAPVPDPLGAPADVEPGGA